MSQTLALRKSAQVTLSGAGAGQVGLGPAVPGVTWTVTGAYVQASSDTAEAVCTLYSAPVGPFQLSALNALGTTFAGSSGDTMGPAIDIGPGQQIVAAWTGGDPGAVATVTVWGTQDTP